MRRILFVWLVPALVAFSPVCPAQPEDVQDLGPKIFQAQWVSAGKLPEDASSIIPSPWGNDPLKDGELEVRAKGQVVVELDGAEAEVAYELWVCKMTATAEDRCAMLGEVPTNDKGKAHAVVPWPQEATGPYAVFFVLRRNDTTMFVSGFHMPSGVPPVTGVPSSGGSPANPPKPEWKEVELKGNIASIGAGSFMVGDVAVLVNDDTRYAGRVKKFDDLKVGMNVEVSGMTAPGGVLAARILVSGKI